MTNQNTDLLVSSLRYFFIFSLSTKIPLPSTVPPFYLCSGGQLEFEGGKRPLGFARSIQQGSWRGTSAHGEVSLTSNVPLIIPYSRGP